MRGKIRMDWLEDREIGTRFECRAERDQVKHCGGDWLH